MPNQSTHLGNGPTWPPVEIEQLGKTEFEPTASAHPGARRERRHLPVLDGVRGIAILLVMLYHFTLIGEFTALNGIDRLYRTSAMGGWSGVDLFFVLSGFLITGILYDAKSSRRYFLNFYARRFLRIFPLYYAVLSLVFIVAPLLAPESSLASGSDQQIWSWTYLTNVLIAKDGWEAGPYYLNHFWSLSVEEQFYLVWPFVILALDVRKAILACVFLIFAAFVSRCLLIYAGNPAAAYVLTISRMDALAFGAVVALLFRSPELVGYLRYAPRVGLAAALVLFGLALGRGGMSLGDPFVQTIGYSALGCIFAASIAWAVLPRNTEGRILKLLSSRTLRTIGKYSYAMYVFHQPVIRLLKKVGITVNTFPEILNSHIPGQAMLLVVAGSITFLISFASWHLLEKHFLRLKAAFASQELSIASARKEKEATA